MTNVPKIGLFCTGKTHIELSVSVRSAYKVMELMREEGYMNGACYTEIIDISDGECVRRAGRTLEHLCTSCELVLTFGCEGYARSDIIPDITDLVCHRKALYFACVLCGAERIKRVRKDRQERQTKQEEKPLRIYPDENEAVSLDSFSGADEPLKSADGEKAPLKERLMESLQKMTARTSYHGEPDGNAKSAIDSAAILRILSKGRSARPDFGKITPESAVQDEYIDLLPSRSSAGILDKTLVLNLTNDCGAALNIMASLAPAIGFAVYNLSGKSAAASAEFESQVKNRLNCDEVLKKICIING